MYEVLTVVLVVAAIIASWNVGYRQGVNAGYDKAQKLLAEFTERQYKDIKARQEAVALEIAKWGEGEGGK